MCAVCGCGPARVGDVHDRRADGRDQGIAHVHHDDWHAHDHVGHAHDHDGHLRDRDLRSLGTGNAGFEYGNLIEVERNIISKNARYADANRRRLAEKRIFALNLVSSPGAGKTTLLVETIKPLAKTVPVSVIEGDQETDNDADRIRATGVEAVQINTGRGCHLDAHMIGHALDELSPRSGSLLFIENVGNLVCPASFDLGEAARVVILSVAEGDDKPLKYPDIFAAAHLMILVKIDLLPHVDFDTGKAIERARRINPNLQVLQLSARNGNGMAEWLDWISEASATAAIAKRVSAGPQPGKSAGTGS